MYGFVSVASHQPPVAFSASEIWCCKQMLLHWDSGMNECLCEVTTLSMVVIRVTEFCFAWLCQETCGFFFLVEYYEVMILILVLWTSITSDCLFSSRCGCQVLVWLFIRFLTRGPVLTFVLRQERNIFSGLHLYILSCLLYSFSSNFNQIFTVEIKSKFWQYFRPYWDDFCFFVLTSCFI